MRQQAPSRTGYTTKYDIAAPAVMGGRPKSKQSLESTMRYPNFTLALVLGLTACAATPLFAQSAAPQARGPMTFADFDRNGDGAVTEQEFNNARAERMAARAAMGAPMRGAAYAPNFADLDRNHDGKMTEDELNAFRQSRMQGGQGAGMGPGYGRGAGAGNAMGPGYGRGMGPGMGMGQGYGRGAGRNMPSFSEFDLNGDGSLTEQEFYQARANRIAERSQQGYPMRNIGNAPAFGAIDLNGDGRVDAQEFAAAQAQHRQQMMRGFTTPQAQPQGR